MSFSASPAPSLPAVSDTNASNQPAEELGKIESLQAQLYSMQANLQYANFQLEKAYGEYDLVASERDAAVDTVQTLRSQLADSKFELSKVQEKLDLMSSNEEVVALLNDIDSLRANLAAAEATARLQETASEAKLDAARQELADVQAELQAEQAKSVDLNDRLLGSQALRKQESAQSVLKLSDAAVKLERSHKKHCAARAKVKSLERHILDLYRQSLLVERHSWIAERLESQNGLDGSLVDGGSGTASAYEVSGYTHSSGGSFYSATTRGVYHSGGQEVGQPWPQLRFCSSAFIAKEPLRRVQGISDGAQSVPALHPVPTASSDRGQSASSTAAGQSVGDTNSSSHPVKIIGKWRETVAVAAEVERAQFERRSRPPVIGFL